MRFCSPARCSWLVALLAALATLAAVADLAQQRSIGGFEDANKLYEEGKFADAAAVYEKVIQSGQVSPALYFNFGNALFKSNRIGRAIAAYQQAARLAPRDPDVRANLQFARNQVQSPTLAPPRWQRWFATLSLNEWTLLTAGAFWVMLVLLGALQLRPALKAALRYWVGGAVLATVVLTSCLGSVLYLNRAGCRAIVIKSEGQVRHGPLDESQVAFAVHDGAELQVLDQKDNWIEVSAGPFRTGWIRRDEVLIPSAIH
jgi:tetratricopeptide (TPR) repeat protein